MNKYTDDELIVFLKRMRKEMLDYPNDSRGQRVVFYQRLWTTLKEHEKL